MRQGLQMIATKTWPVFLFALACVSALAANARARAFIQKGMGEGEVVLKIGKPDHEAFHRDIRDAPKEKTWTVRHRKGLGVRSPQAVYRKLLINSPQHSTLIH